MKKERVIREGESYWRRREVMDMCIWDTNQDFILLVDNSDSESEIDTDDDVEITLF